jgi:hypothetical protein
MYTLQGNKIHMTRTLSALVHIRHSYGSCGQSPYVATFHGVINNVGQGYCSRGKGTLDYNPNTPANWSVGPHPIPPPPHSHWSSRGKTKYLFPTSYIGLLGPYHQDMISMFNTCSWGPTHRSLTETGGRYNLGGASYPHPSPRPFPTDGPLLSLNGPTRSQFINLNINL